MANWVKIAEDQERFQMAIKTDGEKNENADDKKSDEISLARKSSLIEIIRSGFVKPKSNVEIQGQNPSSPVHSVKTFEALHLKDELLKGIYAIGFNTPSRIQETVLPTLLADPPQNLIAQSQPGSGKTAAFVLAMLSRVDTKLHYPQVLYLSPTCEHVIQTGKAAAQMAQFCPDIHLNYAVPEENVRLTDMITDHILIGTPGKALDWGLKYKYFDLKKIRVFILDEFDVMMANYQDQFIGIHKQLSPKCQMLFFSATYTKDDMKFAQHIAPDPIFIRHL